MAASTIFDAPGPVASRRIRIITIVSLIAIAIAVYFAIRQFWINGQLDPEKWSYLANPGIILYLLKGLGNTLLAAAAAVAIAIPLGLLLAVGRMNRLRSIRIPSIVVIEFFRAIPLLLLIYIFFISLHQYGLNPDLFW